MWQGNVLKRKWRRSWETTSIPPPKAQASYCVPYVALLNKEEWKMANMQMIPIREKRESDIYSLPLLYFLVGIQLAPHP